MTEIEVTDLPQDAQLRREAFAHLVCKLLSHKRYPTTAVYAHLSDAPLVDAAEKVGNILATEMAINQSTRPRLK